jgi:phosphatidate cytidylyltransferase|tara:strand:- start:753 stop:1403 length:651 start_codon:yes stop_codon:yes gene_type:complete
MIKNELTKRVSSSLILIPIILFIIIKGSILFNFFITISFIITAYEWLKMSKRNIQKIFGLYFIIISFYTIFQIRNDFNQDYFHILFIAIICISTDIGGYIFGKLLKGPKLTKLSPNKTYSGVIGSFLLAIIFSILFFKLTFKIFNFRFELETFIFVLIISLVSQIGDIIISYFKRLSKIKDTGNIIPGHGGILDRIDGMIFAYPFSYLIFLNWNFQ